MATIAERLLPDEGHIKQLNHKFDEASSAYGLIDHPRKIRHVGVSDLSVELHFYDGSVLRIMNPDFVKGLSFRVYKEVTE